MSELFLNIYFHSMPLSWLARISLYAAGYILLAICLINMYYDRKSAAERISVLRTRVSVLNSENYRLKCANEGVWFNGNCRLPEPGKTVLIRYHRDDNSLMPYIYDTDVCVLDKDGKEGWLKHKDSTSVDWTNIPQG